jgi:hypothetical protein
MDQDLNIILLVSTGSVTVSEETDYPYLQWLEILFNKKLRFNWHVQKTISKALIIASALYSLGNTVYGIKPHLLQQAISACVLRKAYFGAETWWPGCTRPGPRPGSSPISNRVNKQTPRRPFYCHSNRSESSSPGFPHHPYSRSISGIRLPSPRDRAGSDRPCSIHTSLPARPISPSSEMGQRY